MQVAQSLYEGVEIGDAGQVGLITYMRTDSVRIADEAVVAAKNFIVENFGPQFYPETPTSIKPRRVLRMRTKRFVQPTLSIRPNR